MADPRSRTGMLPPWDEEERIARAFKKFRRKMKRYERRERLANQSPWEASAEYEFKRLITLLWIMAAFAILGFIACWLRL